MSRLLTMAADEVALRVRHGERQGYAMSTVARSFGITTKQIAGERSRRAGVVRQQRKETAEESCRGSWWNR